MRIEILLSLLGAQGSLASLARLDVLPRQTTIYSAVPASTGTISSDPWQCATENLTQYFDVPKPTGTLLDALNSYVDELVKPCVSTATGIDMLSCSVSDTSKLCAFSTNAPAAVQTAYASYGSSASSWWAASSSAAMSLAAECPLRWSRFGLIDQAWLNQTIAYAGCYAEAHSDHGTTTSGSSTTTSTAVPGTGATEPAPTSTDSAAGRMYGASLWMLASTGIAAALANGAI